VVAARARRRRAGGWRLEVVTRRVEGALDLGLALAEMGERDTPVRTRTRILSAAGALVRELHDAGFFHADLTPNNLLVSRPALEGDEPHLWVLDLDRSDVRAELDGGERRRNLRRLFRHVAKLRNAGRLRFSITDVRRFLRGYAAPGDDWKDLWRRVQREHGRTRRAHALAGKLERRLGGGLGRDGA
jgi:tRNA A-37 threonylcarbamoyl transferase component Bud32